MSEYTPSTELVRSAWSVGHGDEAPAEFDRWLNTVKAEALREAADEIWNAGGNDPDQIDMRSANPYRKGADA